MIVRDEAAVIERCLRSVRGLIQTWVICDTGSKDRTGELIADVLDGIPGELHQCDWVDFGRNRTDLMQRAYGKADYLLLIDADMTIAYENSRLRATTADSYLLRHDENPEYWVKRLVRGDRRWRFVGPTHEYITTDGPERTEKLDGIVIHHHADGGTRPEKFERDLALLSADLERNPEDARSMFYLAQTYRDLNRLEEAIELYRRRASMGGWEEEVFYSRYQVGVLSERTGDHEVLWPPYWRRGSSVQAGLSRSMSSPGCSEPAACIIPLTCSHSAGSAFRSPTTRCLCTGGSTSGDCCSSTRSPPTGRGAIGPHWMPVTACWEWRRYPLRIASRRKPTAPTPSRHSVATRPPA
jgi:hypothetical protein